MKNDLNGKSFFMGRVTASVSHELLNVLAIIRETAGLMQDFLMMGETCENLTERLEKSLSGIKAQVNRGVTLTHGLNGFAHTADDKTRTIDVREILERLLLVTERITRNKGFTLEIGDIDAPSPTFDPVAFQALFFLCIDAMTQTLPSGRTLVIDFVSHNEKPAITVTCPDPDLNEPPDIPAWEHWPCLTDACDQYGASLTLTEKAPGLRLEFSYKD